MIKKIIIYHIALTSSRALVMDTTNYLRQLASHWNEDWDPAEREWRRRNPHGDLREYRKRRSPVPCSSARRQGVEAIVDLIQEGLKGSIANANSYMGANVREHLLNSEFGRYEHLAEHDLLVAALEKIDALQKSRRT
jgi:hypothetical protein